MTQIQKNSGRNPKVKPLVNNQDTLQPTEASETQIKPKILTPKELNDLNHAHQNLNQINGELQNICYNKEVFLRKFKRQFDSLSLAHEELEQKYKGTLASFENKYGKDNSYNLATGEITPLSQPPKQ
jgi:hypothetical protein